VSLLSKFLQLDLMSVVMALAELGKIIDKVSLGESILKLLKELSHVLA